VACEQLRDKARKADLTSGSDMTCGQAVLACQHCGNKADGSKFCQRCGQTLSERPVCAKCAAPLANCNRFCGECGTPAAA
jgi:hypothetical protein